MSQSRSPISRTTDQVRQIRHGSGNPMYENLPNTLINQMEHLEIVQLLEDPAITYAVDLAKTRARTLQDVIRTQRDRLENPALGSDDWDRKVALYDQLERAHCDINIISGKLQFQSKYKQWSEKEKNLELIQSLADDLDRLCSDFIINTLQARGGQAQEIKRKIENNDPREEAAGDDTMV